MQKYLLTIILSVSSIIVQAHPGGTNTAGCHTNKKMGDYHCHQPEKQAASPSESKTTGTDPLYRQTGLTRADSLSLD